MAGAFEKHPVLGPVWRMDAPDRRAELYVPSRKPADGSSRVAPLITHGALPPSLERSWRAHRAVDLPFGEVRDWNDLTDPAAAPAAPVLLTFAEARLLAAILLGRLPTIAEVDTIVRQCDGSTLLDVPETEVTIWTTDLETHLDPELDRVAAAFPDLRGRREALASEAWLQTGRRRTRRFGRAGAGPDAAQESARCALWLVADAPKRSAAEGAAA
jgi:hypothetical protein